MGVLLVYVRRWTIFGGFLFSLGGQTGFQVSCSVSGSSWLGDRRLLVAECLTGLGVSAGREGVGL